MAADEPRLIDFNVNDHVWVKLTPAGLMLLKKQHDAVRGAGPWKPPKTNEWGWTRFQLWVLMEAFGPDTGWDTPVHFDNTIRIEVPRDE